MTQDQDSDRKALLSIAAMSAMVIAYLLTFSVLTDTDMASRFENGVVPPGTDVTGIRAAALAGIICAVGAWVAAVTSRKTVTVVLVLIASAPFAVPAMIAVGLAF